MNRQIWTNSKTSDAAYQAELAAIRVVADRLIADPVEAKAFLHRAGITTSKGQLAKRYISCGSESVAASK